MRVRSTGSALNAANVVQFPLAGIAFDKITDSAGPFLGLPDSELRLLGDKDDQGERHSSRLL